MELLRRLEDIDPSEVTLCGLPATKKKFLFFKQDMQRLFEKYQDNPDIHIEKDKKINISIESDGTIKGSKIIVNGEEIKNLQDFHFSFYKPRGAEGKEIAGVSPISCSYSKVTETEDGFKHSDTFYLSKSEMEVNIMDPELKKLLDSYFGEEVSFDTEEFEKAKLSDKALNALKGALNLVNKYKADFPDDLKKAVGVLAKYSSYGYPAKKGEEEEDINKAGKALSKDTVSKVRSVVKAFNELQNVIKALNDLLPEEDQKKIKKSDATEGKDDDKEFKKALDEVIDISKKLEKKLDEKDETIEKLNKRLETVEKEKGIKKSIDGQDDDNDGKSDKKWKSFNV